MHYVSNFISNFGIRSNHSELFVHPLSYRSPSLCFVHPLPAVYCPSLSQARVYIYTEHTYYNGRANGGSGGNLLPHPHHFSSLRRCRFLFSSDFPIFPFHFALHLAYEFICMLLREGVLCTTFPSTSSSSSYFSSFFFIFSPFAPVYCVDFHFNDNILCIHTGEYI